MGSPGRAEHIGDTEDGRQVVRVLCSVSTGEDGTADGSIHLLPAGPIVVSRDSRIFQVGDLAAISSATELPVLLDWEHFSEQWGGSSEAAGWIEALETSDGSDGRLPGLWGNVRWTAKGKADVESGAFRFISPALVITNDDTRTVIEIVSCGLTNKPALRLAEIGLFAELLPSRLGRLQTADRLQTAESEAVGEAPAAREETTSMKPESRVALCAALSLAHDAADGDILAATGKLGGVRELLSQTTTQANATTTELLSAKARITELETEVLSARAEAAKATTQSRITALFEENKTKITPAMAKGYREMFSKHPATLDAFIEFQLPNLPEIGAAAPASVAASTAPAGATSVGSASTITEKFSAKLRRRNPGMTDAQIAEASAFAAKASNAQVDDDEDEEEG
jgi:phage I-like protein